MRADMKVRGQRRRPPEAPAGAASQSASRGSETPVVSGYRKHETPTSDQTARRPGREPVTSTQATALGDEPGPGPGGPVRKTTRRRAGSGFGFGFN